MKTTLSLITILVIVLVFSFILLNKNSGGNLVAPGLNIGKTNTETPAPTNAAPVAPKSFQFDSSTDLNAELEKINPEVSDSDFE